MTTQPIHALAVLGPRSRASHVLPFQSPDARLEVLDTPDIHTMTAALNRQPKPAAALIFGGDGTLNRHLGPLAASGVPVLIVPTGSGNDFAKTNNIFSIVDAVGVWKCFLAGTAKVVPFDLGYLETPDGPRYFACCANIGLDADATRRANRFPIWLKSHGGYILAALAAIACFQPQTITLSGDSFATISEPAWFISICNTPTYGGGLKGAPNARTNDNLLDIVFVQRNRAPRWSVVRNFPKIIDGTHVHLSTVKTFQSRSFRVETGHPMPVYADGDHLGYTPCGIRVASAAIPVLTR